MIGKVSSLLNGRIPLMGIFAAIMVVFAIIGGYLHYTPIPFWDTWDGYFGLVFGIQNDESYYSWFWRQHNEHRILLTRLLFLMDYHIFGGTNKFLICVNYALVFMSFSIFYLFTKHLFDKDGMQKRSLQSIQFFILGWLFFWNPENLSWEFQSQFFMAQSLPLLSLYFLAQASVLSSWYLFLVACVFGALSLGTMANGVLTLPIMFLSSLFMTLDKKRKIILFVMAVILPVFYFHDFNAIPHHGSLTDALKNDPLNFVRYVARYLGGPFNGLFGGGKFGKSIAEISGYALLTLSAIFAYKAVFTRNRSAHIVALLGFSAYVIATAIGTAGGRLIFGLEQATSQRYLTPTTMIWVAVGLIIFYQFSSKLNKFRKPVIAFFTILCSMLVIYQSRALVKIEDTLYEKQLAVLALELGIKDETYLKKIYPFPEGHLKRAEQAKARKAFVFGMEPFAGLSQQIGKHVGFSGVLPCQGNLDMISSIDGVSDYVKVLGWSFSSQRRTSPKLIRFLDIHGTTVGFALTGALRTDLLNAIDPKAGRSGFVGYILTSSLKDGKLLAFADDMRCGANLNIPALSQQNSQQ